MKERERNSWGNNTLLEWIASHRWSFSRRRNLLFWVLVIGFLVMRYGFGIRSHRVFLWLLALNLLSFLALGIIDFRETGQFSTFQVVVVVALVYSVTYESQRHETSGSVHETQNRPLERGKPPSGRRSPPAEREKEEKKKYGRLHAREQRRGWYLHLLLFLIAHFVFATLFGWKTASGIGGWVETWIDTWNAPELFPFPQGRG